MITTHEYEAVVKPGLSVIHYQGRLIRLTNPKVRFMLQVDKEPSQLLDRFRAGEIVALYKVR